MRYSFSSSTMSTSGTHSATVRASSRSVPLARASGLRNAARRPRLDSSSRNGSHDDMNGSQRVSMSMAHLLSRETNPSRTMSKFGTSRAADRAGETRGDRARHRRFTGSTDAPFAAPGPAARSPCAGEDAAAFPPPLGRGTNLARRIQRRRTSMTPPDTRRWEAARQEMLKRWERILRKIDARDEGRALVLANMMDEFCEVAVEQRKAAAGDEDDPAIPVLKFPRGAEITGRCVFCRALVKHGGCFGPLHALNKALLDGRWAAARQVAEEQLERIRGLVFEARADETVH